MAIAQPTVFTAQQIATAVGVAKRSVLRRLDNAASAVVFVNSQQTKAWAISTLPIEWQTKLEGTANQLGCRSSAHLLSLSVEPWQPPVPLSRCVPESVERAAKLQSALALPLRLRNDTTRSAADFEAIGLRDYAAAFGYTVSARHWRELLNRTLARDGGRNDFGRLELYLDEKPALAPELPKPGTNDLTQHLHHIVLAFGDPAKPSVEEIRLLWHEAFSIYERTIAQGEAEKKARRSVLRFLISRPYGLAKNMASLRKVFAAKLQMWRENGGHPDALKDQRKEKAEFKLSQSDLDALVTRGLECGGHLSQAYRELVKQKALSTELLARLPKSDYKSFVPHWVRSQAQPEIQRMMPYHRGPREHILSGPSLTRNYDNLFFGDVYQADDTTLPVRWVDASNPEDVKVVRGQVLVMIDVATLKIVSWVLIPAAQYSAKHILLLMQKTVQVWGLPRFEWYYERSLWQRAKLVKGTTTALPQGEIQLGFKAEFGVDFVHARLPRAKVVEKVIGLIQNRMERLTGYVGRDERYDRFERVQKQKLNTESVNKRPALADEYFPTLEEWNQELAAIVSYYNNDPQQGRILRGLSPNQAAIAKENKGNPQIGFDARCQYLLSHYKEVRPVQSFGIRIKEGRYDEYTYCNEATGRLVGEQVIVWRNLETPEHIVITDLDRKNPVVVPRVEHVQARGESSDVLHSEQAKITAHLNYARDRYHVVKPERLRPFRQNLLSPDVLATGEEIARQTEAVQAQQQETAVQATKAQRSARQAGLDVVIAGTKRQADALGTLAKLKEKHGAKS